MGKYDFIKDKHIVPVHKNLSLEYEADYNGKTETIDVRVYPYTVEEKLKFKNKNDEGSKLMESKDEKEKEHGIDLVQEATYEAVFDVLKKDDNEITLDHIKKMPESWLDKIIFKALEFEGITEEQIKDKSKKDFNKL